MIGTHLHTRDADASILSSLDSKALSSATGSDQSTPLAPEDFASMLWSLIEPGSRKSSDPESDSSSETPPVSQNDDRSGLLAFGTTPSRFEAASHPTSSYSGAKERDTTGSGDFSNQHADSTSDYKDVSPYSKDDSKGNYLPFARFGTADSTPSTYEGFVVRAGAGSFEPENSKSLTYKASAPSEADPAPPVSNQPVGVGPAKNTPGASYEADTSRQPHRNPAISADIENPRTAVFSESTVVERAYNVQGSSSSYIALWATAFPTSSTNSHDLFPSKPSSSSPKAQTITNTSATAINSNNMDATSESRPDNRDNEGFSEVFAPFRPAFNDAGPRAIAGSTENSTFSSTLGMSPHEVAPESAFVREIIATAPIAVVAAAKNPISIRIHSSTDLLRANETSTAVTSSKTSSPESGNYLKASTPAAVSPSSSKIAPESESAEPDRHQFISVDSIPTPIAQGKSIERHSRASAVANSDSKGPEAGNLLESQPRVSVTGDSNTVATSQGNSSDRQIQSSAVSRSNRKGSPRSESFETQVQASIPASLASHSSTAAQSRKSTLQISKKPFDREPAQDTQILPLGISGEVMPDRPIASAHIPLGNEGNSVSAKTKDLVPQSPAAVGRVELVGNGNRAERFEGTTMVTGSSKFSDSTDRMVSTNGATQDSGRVSITAERSSPASRGSTHVSSIILSGHSTTATGRETLSAGKAVEKQATNAASSNYSLDSFAAVPASSSQSSRTLAVTSSGSTNADDTQSHTRQSSAQRESNATITDITIDNLPEPSVARTTATLGRTEETATYRTPMTGVPQSPAGQQPPRASAIAGFDAAVPSAKHEAASSASKAFTPGDDKLAQDALPRQGAVDRSSGSIDTRVVSASADDGRPALRVTSEGDGKNKAAIPDPKADSYPSHSFSTAAQGRVSRTAPGAIADKPSTTTPSSASIRPGTPIAPSPSDALRPSPPSQKPMPVLPSVDGARSAETSPRGGGVELQITKPGQTLVSPAESGRTANLTVQLGDGQTAHATIREREGSVDVKIVTSSSATAERMSGELDSMRQNFDAAGLRLGHSEVSYQNGRGDSGRGREQYQRQSQADQSTNDVFTLSEVVE